MSKKYVIYCRKSTDESSGKQTQSIPDQIRACLRYAKDRGLEIMIKPDDFSQFESTSEIEKENDETDIDNRRTYIETRDLFIVKEQKSAKIPKERPKWNKLIKMIDKGEIEGLLSYSPDRQARNLVEGGEIINLADEKKVDLKYANFHYENSASGNMMLGVWFVFSKQYSDKLSEDIQRGNLSKHKAGKTLGYFKYGYTKTENDYWTPDPETFDIIREAFDKRLLGETNKTIADWLRNSGVKKQFKSSGKEMYPSEKNLSKLWIDPFYCGLWIYDNNEVDLSEFPDYIPMVTKDEHRVLVAQYEGMVPKLSLKKRKDEMDEITPISNTLIRSIDGAALSMTLPNKHRHVKNLREEREKNKQATLKDIVSPDQIYYRVARKDSKNYNLSMRFSEISAAIYEQLLKLKVNKKEYERRRGAIIEGFIERMESNEIERRSLEASLRILNGQERDYLRRNMGKSRDEKEDEIYTTEKKRYATQIAKLEKDIAEIKEQDEQLLEDLENLIASIRNIAESYNQGSYVRKRKLCDIFFSNIKITPQKSVELQIREELLPLFDTTWWTGWGSNPRPKD